MEVFKIQRPIIQSGYRQPTALVYNKDRSIEFEMPMKGLEVFFDEWAKDELKVYVNAEIRGEAFHVDGEAEEPDW